MWGERAPDRTEEVSIGKHRVVTYSFGSGDNVVLLLNGGPGLPCDYLREAHSFLADHGMGPPCRAVVWGCGDPVLDFG